MALARTTAPNASLLVNKILELEGKNLELGSIQWGFQTSCGSFRSQLLTLIKLPPNIPTWYLNNGMTVPGAEKMEKVDIKNFRQDNYGDNSLLMELLSVPNKPEHFFYSFGTNCDGLDLSAHTFVIEKMFDGKNLYFRVFQAYLCKFRGSEWLSPESLYEDPETSDRHYHDSHKLYGQGKLLGLDEIKDFLKHEMEYLFRGRKKTKFWIDKHKPDASLNPFMKLSCEKQFEQMFYSSNTESSLEKSSSQDTQKLSAQKIHEQKFNTSNTLSSSIKSFPNPQKLSAPEIIKQLTTYILNRTQEYENTKKEYNSFWGRLTGMSYTVKVNAAKKMLNLMQGNQIIPFSDQELDALRDPRLGSIIFQCEQNGLLPQEFIRSENIKMKKNWRVLR